MLERLSRTFGRYANGWLVIALAIGEMLFNVLILPKQQARLAAASGGTGPIDLLLFYTPTQVYSMVASYGEAGRASYRLFELTGDILYPIVYTLFFALLITWLFQRGFPPGSRMQKLNVVPLGTWLFDLFENLGIVAMLSAYPAAPAGLAWLTAAFTGLKWMGVAATVALLLIGLVTATKNSFRKQSAAAIAS